MSEEYAVALVDDVGSALQSRGPSGVEVFLKNLDAVARASEALAKGGYYGERNPNVIGTWMMLAMELGVPLGVVAKNVYKFGKSVGMMGSLQLGLASSRCGITVEHVERTSEVYRGIMRRPGWPDMNLYFDTEMALQCRLLRRKPPTEEHPEGEIVAWSLKDGDVWDHWRYRMLMWKGINDGLTVMGADYFAVHQIRDMETVQMMAREETEAHRHDASEELRATVVSDEVADGEIAELEALVAKAESLDLQGAELLSFADRANITAVVDDRDITRIRGWTEEITGLLDRAKWAETKNEAPEDQAGLSL